MSKNKLKYSFFLLLFISVFFLIAQEKQPNFKTLFKKIDSTFYTGNLSDYQKLLWKANHLAKQKKDTLNLLKTNKTLLKYHLLDKRNEDSLLYYYEKGNKILENYQHPEYRAYFDYLYAEFLVDKGKYSEAYKIFSALESNIISKNYNFLPFYYSAFSKLHYRLNEIDLAFDKLKKAGIIFKNRGKRINTSSIYNNLGVLYRSRNQLDSSLVYYKKSLKISTKINDTIGIAYSSNNIGYVYFLQEKPFKAEEYYTNALKINPKNPSKALLNNYSEILIARGKYNKAETLLLKIKNEVTEPQIKINALLSLITLNKIQKKYAKALNLQDTLLVLKERLINSKKIEEIERLKALHDTKEKAKQILLLKKQVENKDLILKQNRIIATVITSILFLISLIIVLIWRNKMVTAKANELFLEQQLLRSQMNPHFIFNALSNIQSTILKNENAKAVGYLVKFSKLIRNILENSKDTKITFSKEIQALKGYLDLQKIRFNDQFIYSITIDDAIEDELIHIPTMLFQPLVENAIEHGIENINNGKIDLIFNLKPTFIECIINDNGVGFSNTKNHSSDLKKSMSTQIIKDRLAIFSKKMKYQLQFTIGDIIESETIKGTQVRIEIPIIN